MPKELGIFHQNTYTCGPENLQFRTPITKRELVERYLYEKGHNLKEIVEYSEWLPPMGGHVIGVIVACAYNERDNVERFIESIASQSFSKQTALSPKNFEVLIVPNNCSDDTRDIALYARKRHEPSISTLIVEKNFPPEKAGLGSARKFGFDLALHRFLRSSRTNSEFYLISVDTDSPVPPHHLEKVVTTFRISGADALSGDTDFLSIADFLSEDTPNLNNLYRLYVQKLLADRSRRRRLNTSGGNSAVTASMYALVGGIENVNPGQDSQFCKKLVDMGAKISRLSSAIHENPRRALGDPLRYTTPDPQGLGVMAYRPTVFAQANTRDLPKPYPDISRTQAQEVIHQFSLLSARDSARTTGVSPDRLYERILADIYRVVNELGIPIKF